MISRYTYGLNKWLSIAVLIGGIWCSSGSMAPYAISCRWTVFDDRCGYVYNIDHGQFVAAYDMLAGRDKEAYAWSVVLRRIFYPLVCFPFMKAFGFETGGLLVNVIITILAFIYFADFLSKKFGCHAAIVGMWLMATFPGIFYFSGMPYSYATIVPLTLVMLVILWKAWETNNTLMLLVAAVLIGVLSTSYDFLPLFGPVYIVLLFLKRKYWIILLSAALMALPSVLVAIVLKYHFGVDLHNANTDMYGNVLSGFRGDIDYSGWLKLMLYYPVVLFDNFFGCGFMFMPALFLFVVLFNWRYKLVQFEALELVLLAVVGLMHAVNNLVPPYGGWSLRGIGMARLYEPIVLVEILFVARYYQRLIVLSSEERKRVCFLPQMAMLVLTMGLNATVVIGGIFDSPVTPYVYHRFYRHSSVECWEKNINLYGKRLYGFHQLGTMHRVDLEDPASTAEAKRILSKRRHK